jgi:hypothetical protein
MKKILLVFVATLVQLSIVYSQADQANPPILKGPYLGQTPPGNQSKVFAPGFVSTEYGELNSVFTADGKEFYFSRRGMPGQASARTATSNAKEPTPPPPSPAQASKIMISKMIDALWTKPEPIGFTGIYSDIDLFITPDGKSMVFCSTRPHKTGEVVKTDHDFWISKRQGDSWAEPVLFAKEAVSEFEDFFPVVTRSGNLYFNSQRGGPGTNDIYCSRYVDGKHTSAEKLPAPINTEYREFDAFVSQNESMIIFSSVKPGGFGGSDIYISFKSGDGSWSEPVNLGNDINSSGSEYGATISQDGKYFFYTSNKNGTEDIYWVSANIIEELWSKRLK